MIGTGRQAARGTLGTEGKPVPNALGCGDVAAGLSLCPNAPIKGAATMSTARHNRIFLPSAALCSDMFLV